MRKLIKVLCCTVLLFVAHEGFSVTGPLVPGPPPPQNIPIDGGLSWLLAAGGVYGVSKLRKNFRK